MGRRVKKAVYAYGSGGWELQKEILFVYDGWNLIHEKEVSGTGDPLFDKFYVWGLDLSQTLQGAGGISGLVCRVVGGEVRHYLYDANGNVGQLVNPADGAITAWYEYDPFGKMLVADGMDAEGNVFRFSTKYWDGETYLVYFGYRYYAPKIGRWMSRDPVNELGSMVLRFHTNRRDSGINTYLYTSNAPICYVDPFGLLKIPDGYKVIYEDGIQKLVMRKSGSAFTFLRILTRVIPYALAVDAFLTIMGPRSTADPDISEFHFIYEDEEENSIKYQTHHLIPWKNSTYNHQAHPLINLANENLQTSKGNLIYLGNHSGPHSHEYHQVVRDLLDDAYECLPNQDQQSARKAVDEIYQILLDGINSGAIKPYQNKDVFIP